MRKPVYLVALYRVPPVERGVAKRRGGIGAILRLADDTVLFCSQLEHERDWYIDSALDKDYNFLVSNPFGARSTDYDDFEDVLLRQDVVAALNERVRNELRESPLEEAQDNRQNDAEEQPAD